MSTSVIDQHLRLATRDVALKRFRAIVNSLHSLAKGIEQRSGVSNGELFVLQMIQSTPTQMTVGDLALKSHASRPAVSMIVRRLERDGLIERSESAEAPRRKTFVITDAGARVCDRSPESPTKRVIQAMERLDDGALDELALGLLALARELEVDLVDPPLLFEPRRRH
jgi:DNA-binding MarR family transcriptional regulator